MEKNNSKAAVDLLMHVRETTNIHLPIGHSFIPYEILIIVINFHLNGEELTVKKLFNTGSFSEMGNRYHFKKLIEREWLVIKDHPQDSRVKLVTPSPKLLSAFEKVSNDLRLAMLTYSAI
jgi:hypothetical protein